MAPNKVHFFYLFSVKNPHTCYRCALKPNMKMIIDKLLEEQDAAAKHSYEAEQLRLLCKKQSLQIEVLKKSREEVRGKLLSTVKELEK